MRRILFVRLWYVNPYIVAWPLHHFERHTLTLFGHFVERTPDKALHGIQCIFWVDGRLSLGGQTHQPLTILGERYHRWRRAVAFRVRNDDHIATFHNCNARVRRAKVNSYNLAHITGLPLQRCCVPCGLLYLCVVYLFSTNDTLAVC